MQRIAEELENFKRNSQYRTIPKIFSKTAGKINIEGIDYINFASNDYLGVSTDTELKNEFIKSNCDYSMSSASARLLTGSTPEFLELEKTLAKLFNKEASLIFNTGYQANLGVITALTGKDDVIFSDKLNHASIIDGMRLSGGKFIRYKHLDYDNLEELLKKNRNNYKRCLIISESVFSMDGDSANIDRLIELKNKYNALLMVDEAHAFFTVGQAGLSLNKDVDIITATFGKSLGSFGAFCVSNSTIIEYLVNKARSFIFSTAIPPINIAWTNWLLTEKYKELEQKRKILNNLTNKAHKLLYKYGISTNSSTQIIPIIIGKSEDAIKITEKLKSQGYYIPAIRPPTVPQGSSRLRISLTADHSANDFERVIQIITKND